MYYHHRRNIFLKKRKKGRRVFESQLITNNEGTGQQYSPIVVVILFRQLVTGSNIFWIVVVQWTIVVSVCCTKQMQHKSQLYTTRLYLALFKLDHVMKPEYRNIFLLYLFIFRRKREGGSAATSSSSSSSIMKWKTEHARERGSIQTSRVPFRAYINQKFILANSPFGLHVSCRLSGTTTKGGGRENNHFKFD